MSSVAHIPQPRWSERTAEAVRSNIRWALPLLLLGVVALAVGTVAYLQAGHSPPTRFPLWGLALAIGAVSLGGGLVALFASDFGSEASRGIVRLGSEEMVVPKEEWLELRKQVDRLSQRSREETSRWSESEEPPVSLTFMPAGTPPKASGRRHGRGTLFGRAPSGPVAPIAPPPAAPVPEPPAPPPAPLTDSRSRLPPPVTEPEEEKPATSSDSG
ncbi:MAG TPA: hypothetical protein VGU43_01070 [Thermoplasmata archaeon]|nr:hypothetical protein [Thermoplasmata archaeon]